MAKAGRGDDQYMVRFPEGLRDRIKGAAEENGRSMNTEIVARLEDSFDENLSIPPALYLRIARHAATQGQRARDAVIELLELAFPVDMSFSSYLDRFVLKIVGIRDADERKAAISALNSDVSAQETGFWVSEGSLPDGSRVLKVMGRQPDRDRGPRVLAMLPIEAGNEV